MDRLSPTASITLALLLAALSRPAMAEYLPPPKLADFLRADCAAVGRFVEEDGAALFVTVRLLWGDTGAIDRLPKGEDARVRVEPGCGLTAWVWGSPGGLLASPGGICPADATRRAIWFFFKDSGPCQLAAQPLELTPGFLALRDGKRPSAVFRLLQKLDFDMHRDALEEFYADRDEGVLAALHRIALNTETLAAFDAIEVLIRARLLDAERFWDRWTNHPAMSDLQEVLLKHDADRVARELRRAVAAEKRPSRLHSLLYQARNDVDLNLQYLDHAAEEVRRRALGNLYDRLWQLARDPDKAPEAEALGRPLLPLLEARRKVETSKGARLTLDKMLERQAGVPWVLRVPKTEDPPPAYSEAEERRFIISRLTSHGQHGFVMESAGREITEHFFAEGFERLKKAAASPDYNQWMVYEGMGYVRHPRVFEHLVKQARTMSVGDGRFPATLRAIGRQNHERSFEVLKELIERRVRKAGGFARSGACDALGYVHDRRALALLKEMEGVFARGHALRHYLRARAAHGDPWAVKKLLAALRELEPSQSADVLGALLLSDTPEVTEALKRYVRDAWPSRWETSDDNGSVSWCMRMQNCAGNSRRATAIGEVARRDPRWLAEFALQKLESPSLSARLCGAYIFRGLTGRSFGFRAGAFASERTAPLKALRAWWAEHRTETRDQWLLSYFRERGFRMTRLHDKGSLPVLVRALHADEFTHGLAIEQISVITGKYFGNYAQPTLEYRDGATVAVGGGGYELLNQERATIRVIGWLAARNILPAGR